MRNWLKIAVLAFPAVAFTLRPAVSSADRFTLADIRELCAAADDSAEFAFCRGYVVALVDAVIVTNDPDCIPPMVNDFHFALIMRKFLNTDTEHLRQPAVDGILNVISATFRCLKKGTADIDGKDG